MAFRFDTVEFLDSEALLGLAKDLDGRASRAQLRAAARYRASFAEWVDHALLKGAGPAHRWVAKTGVLPPLNDHGVLQHRLYDTPNGAMMVRTDFWRKHWTRDKGKLPELRSAFSENKKLILSQRDDHPDRTWNAIEVGQIGSALTTWGTTGLDCDQWDPPALKRLPREGKEKLAKVLAVELHLCWPVQVMLNGGERPIAPICFLYRLWAKVRRPSLVAWEAEHIGFWDTAVKNSSALRAALLRLLYQELAIGEGLDLALLLWDLEKFYDSISLLCLVKLSLKLDYPLELLHLGSLIHISPRVLKASRFFGEVLVPGNGILAGCTQVITFARVALFEVLETAHKVFPNNPIASYVDDLSQRGEGQEKNVHREAVASALHLAQGLHKASFKLSTKSVLVSSSPELGRKIERSLQGLGVKIKFVAAARDLGIDNAGGKRRSVKIQQSRRAKASKRTTRIGRLLKLHRGARKLYTTGAYPQGTWGLVAIGVPPQTIRDLRAQAASVSGVRAQGKCTTTGIALGFGSRKDPAIILRIEQMKERLHLWRSASTSLRQRIAKVWGASLGKMVRGFRWTNITGPMHATMATCFDVGWKPVRPDKFVSPSGALWKLSDKEGASSAHFWDGFANSIELQLWTKASQARLGQGLHTGVDWTVSKKHASKLLKEDMKQHHGLLQTFQASAMWTEST